MSVTLSLFAGVGAQFLDNNGNILSGGLIYTYGAGTTTPLATYTSNLGTDSHPNPIVLDSAGRIPGGELWLTYGLGYKFVTKDSNGVLIGTYDNVPTSAQPPIVNDASSVSYEQGATVIAGNFVIGQMYRIATLGNTNFQTIGASANQVGILFTATGVGSGTGTAEYSRSVATKFGETISVKDFGAIGDGVTNDTIAIQKAIDSGHKVFLPKGNYLFSSLSFQGSNYGGLFGEGVELTALIQDGSAVDAISIGTVTQAESFSFTDFRLDGNGTCNNGFVLGHGANTSSAANLYFTRVWIRKFTKTNMSGMSLLGAQEIILDNCRLEGCYNNLTHISTNAYNYLTAFVANNATRFAGALNYGLVINNTNSNAVLGIKFQNCVFEGNTNGVADITAGATSPIVFDNCYLENNGLVANCIEFNINGLSSNYCPTVQISNISGGGGVGTPRTTINATNAQIYVSKWVAIIAGITDDAGCYWNFYENKYLESAGDFLALYATLNGIVNAIEYNSIQRLVYYSNKFYGLQSHFCTAQTILPTIVVNANAGTGATATLNTYATDTSGTIVLNIGSGSWATGTQCAITFNKSYLGGGGVMRPTIFLTPVDGTNSSLQSMYVTNIVDGGTGTTTGFNLCFGTAMSSGAYLQINYFVVGGV